MVCLTLRWANPPADRSAQTLGVTNQICPRAVVRASSAWVSSLRLARRRRHPSQADHRARNLSLPKGGVAANQIRPERAVSPVNKAMPVAVQLTACAAGLASHPAS